MCDAFFGLFLLWSEGWIWWCFGVSMLDWKKTGLSVGDRPADENQSKYPLIGLLEKKSGPPGRDRVGDRTTRRASKNYLKF